MKSLRPTLPPVDVLAPGTAKTKTGRLWVYLRDERHHAGTAPPAVLYRYTPDRKGEHCRKELANFTGWLHADGYAGFARLYEIAGLKASDAALMHGPPRITEVGCWSHVRRGFFDEWSEHKSAIAKEALDRIGVLFDIERTIAGSRPEIRRAVRQRTARPKIDELGVWLDAQLAKIPGKSDLAKAIRYARWRWHALTRYLERWSPRNLEQCRRKQDPPGGFGPQELAVLRIGCRRYARCRVLYADRHRAHERHRARSLADQRHRPHRCASDQPSG